MQLAGRVALVTGADSGLGKAAALRLAREGAKIAALDRTDEELKKTVEEIQKAGGGAIPLIADISQPQAVEEAMARDRREVGKAGHCVRQRRHQWRLGAFG